MFLFSELVFGYFLNRNFIFGVFNFYTFFVLILFTLLFSYSRINNIFSLLNIALLNLILVDKEWRILDTYIRPGGSDSLTYESLSRIVLLSEPLRGGEAVYHYSPGARYINLLLHLLFGDRFKLIWVTVLTVTTFLIIRYLVDSNSVNKIYKYIAVITILIYLTSNGVQRVFYYGMSESYALLFFALLLNIQKNHKALINLVAGIVVLIRPVFLLGVMSYLIYIKLNFKELKKFYFLILLPLVHNLFFGSSFVIFTKSWDSALDILEESQEFFKHIMRNISYIIMAPYNEDVITRVGSLIPFFTFTFFLIYIFILLNKLTHIELSYLDTTPVLLSTPLLFYDIYYFYPRFLIVTHVFVFIVVLKNIKIMTEKILLKKNNTFISLLKV